MKQLLVTMMIAVALAASAEARQTREEKVRADKSKVEADGYWIYNDLPAAFDEARQTGKPIVVVLRCIPCEECVKLDDELVDKNPVIRALLDQYVRVRVVATNGLDLSLFQYDYDQSFACFLLNADGTIYGRFGTRSHRTQWLGDVSLEGLAQALEGGLELHADYPKNRQALAGKRGPAPLFATPEEFPELKNQYASKLDYQGDVVRSCIHCHQIGDAIRDYHRGRNEALPEDVLFPYPHPKSVGLVLDPKERATVVEVLAGRPATPAERAGFQAGDRILALNEQPLLSIADLQWVLHRADPKGARIQAKVLRGGAPTSLELVLGDGWRQADSISWRASSWGFRRMVTAGMKLDPLDGPRPEGVPTDGMALRVAHVGQYGGPHGAAKAAGIQVGDTLIAFDGQDDLQRETDIFAYALRKTRPGEPITVGLVRNGVPLQKTIPMQK